MVGRFDEKTVESFFYIFVGNSAVGEWVQREAYSNGAEQD